MSFTINDTCYISFDGKPTEAYISDKKDCNGYYMVTVPDGGLGGFENAELPVYEDLVFSDRDACFNFYINDLKNKISKLESLR